MTPRRGINRFLEGQRDGFQVDVHLVCVYDGCLFLVRGQTRHQALELSAIQTRCRKFPPFADGWKKYGKFRLCPPAGGVGSAFGNPISLCYHMQHTVQQLFHSGPTFQDSVRTSRPLVGF